MNPIKQANELFRDGRYREALEHYIEARDKHGYRFLDSVIEICRNRLKVSKNFDHSIQKPSIAVLITDRENLKYYPQFSHTEALPFDLRLYFNSSDGVRSLHSVELLDSPENVILPLDKEPITLPRSDFAVTLDDDAILSEADLISFISFKTGIRENNPTPLTEIKIKSPRVVPGRVSVVIPTYKRPTYLRNAIKSVVEQDYKDIEVIVVCDNGKNSEYNQESREIVGFFAGIRPNCQVVLLEHTVNRNGAAARNTGILHSTGEYICFLDDDDIYLPGRIGESVKALRTQKKTVGAVYCGYIGWNSERNDPSRYRAGNLTLEILLLEYEKHYLHTTTATYRREAIMSLNGFDETYHRHQDLELNLRFFEQYEIDVVEDALVAITPEPSDVSNQVNGLDLLHLKEKFLKQFNYLIDTFPTDIRQKIYDVHIDRVLKSVDDDEKIADHYRGSSQDFNLRMILKLLERK